MEQLEFGSQQTSDVAETVYDSLHGYLLEENQPSWVKTVFVPGNPCFAAFDQAYAVCARLRQRLNVEDTDDDLEDVVHCLQDYGKYLALEMFRYGRMYQKMLDSEEKI